MLPLFIEIKNGFTLPSEEALSKIAIKRAETELARSLSSVSNLCNDLWYNTYELTFGQYYKYEQAGWRLSLGCPLNLYTQTLDDRIRQDKHSYTHLLVSPTFSASYEWRNWSGNVNASYYKNVGDPGGIYSGYIMNNYRSFSGRMWSSFPRPTASMRVPP